MTAKKAIFWPKAPQEPPASVVTGARKSYRSKINTTPLSFQLNLFRCLLGQHPRIRWNRRKRSAIMEKYKRAFIRNQRFIYGGRERRHVHNYLHLVKENSLLHRRKRSVLEKPLFQRVAEVLNVFSRIRRKRALKGNI